MKNLFFLLLSSFTLCLTSCEKAESDHAKHERLGIRAESCQYCPPADCCCWVELTGTTQLANLTFCGTTNPDISTNVCGPIDLEAPCEPVVGFYWTHQLTDDNNETSTEFFCVEKGTSFMIGCANNATVRFTCQYGQTSPTFTPLIFTSGDKRYFTVDNDCEVDECHLD